MIDYKNIPDIADAPNTFGRDKSGDAIQRQQSQEDAEIIQKIYSLIRYVESSDSNPQTKSFPHKNFASELSLKVQKRASEGMTWKDNHVATFEDIEDYSAAADIRRYVNTAPGYTSAEREFNSNSLKNAVAAGLKDGLPMRHIVRIIKEAYDGLVAGRHRGYVA